MELISLILNLARPGNNPSQPGNILKVASQIQKLRKYDKLRFQEQNLLARPQNQEVLGICPGIEKIHFRARSQKLRKSENLPSQEENQLGWPQIQVLSLFFFLLVFSFFFSLSASILLFLETLQVWGREATLLCEQSSSSRE